MNKSFALSIIVIGTIVAVNLLAVKPHQTGLCLGETWAAQAIVPTDSQQLRKAAYLSPLPGDELDYYLKRHNLEDEGYEMVVAFAGGKRHEVVLDQNIPLWNVGEWNSHRREGTAIALDALGRTIVGVCRNDSITMGVRVDSTGNYVGDFRQNQATGHGAYTRTDVQGYYEGHWIDGQRDGFGLAVETATNGEMNLRAGIWHGNRFMGERMRYTTERIYGIDISRYQHGKGRKKFPIHWNRLRITHVGKRGNHNVSGIADYPVSFVYIKSTEGTTIRNQYFVADYRKARRQGIRTGAYHFWSVRRDGAEQAKYFIRNTLFCSGDLPPVLDIEPSDAQIRMMGGEERMFEHIRTWLRIVEHHVGVKPILYVNQRFVNNYLSKQTDLKRDYSVWIARYSEYKPDLRLTFWQLSSDGRVAGIQGDVDINVFNGYQSQFESFLEETCIQK